MEAELAGTRFAVCSALTGFPEDETDATFPRWELGVATQQPLAGEGEGGSFHAGHRAGGGGGADRAVGLQHLLHRAQQPFTDLCQPLPVPRLAAQGKFAWRLHCLEGHLGAGWSTFLC